MTKTITVAKLRQNPTQALKEVEHGEEYIVTRHNKEIGRLVPLQPRREPVTQDRAESIFHTSPLSSDWEADLQHMRDRYVARDPWHET